MREVIETQSEGWSGSVAGLPRDGMGMLAAQLLDHGEHFLRGRDRCVMALPTRTRFQCAEKPAESFLLTPDCEEFQYKQPSH